MDFLPMFFPLLGSQVPTLLVAVLGLVLAFVKLRDHPVPARLVLLASAVLIALSIVQPLTTVVSMQRRQAGVGYRDDWVFVMVLPVVVSLFRNGAIVALIFAAFAGRRRDPRTTPPPL